MASYRSVLFTVTETEKSPPDCPCLCLVQVIKHETLSDHKTAVLSFTWLGTAQPRPQRTPSFTNRLPNLTDSNPNSSQALLGTLCAQIHMPMCLHTHSQEDCRKQITKGLECNVHFSWPPDHGASIRKYCPGLRLPSHEAPSKWVTMQATG